MSGPDATLLLRQKLSKDEMWSIISKACQDLRLPVERTNVPSYGGEGTDVANVLLIPKYDLDISLESDFSTEEDVSLDEFYAAAGYVPQASATLTAYTRYKPAAQIMLRLCAQVSRSAENALVDLHGLVLPSERPTGPPNALLEISRSFVARHPGLVIERPYEIEFDTIGYTHVVSAEFIESWILDEDFQPII